MIDVIEVLDASGHLSLRWNPSNPVEVSKAREDVERLKAAGYSFFAVVGATGADEIEAGDGMLIVERLADPVRPPPTVEATYDAECRVVGGSSECPAGAVGGTGAAFEVRGGQSEPPTKPKRGRPPKAKAEQERRVVAVRPQAGG